MRNSYFVTKAVFLVTKNIFSLIFVTKNTFCCSAIVFPSKHYREGSGTTLGKITSFFFFFFDKRKDNLLKKNLWKNIFSPNINCPNPTKSKSQDVRIQLPAPLVKTPGKKKQWDRIFKI